MPSYRSNATGPRNGLSIPGSTAGNSLLIAFFGLIFGGAGLACLLASLLKADMQGRNIGIGLGSVFLAIGLLLLIGGILSFVHRRKFGVASLRLAQSPVCIGGRLAGVLEVPSGIVHADRFKLRLTCSRVNYKRRSGGGAVSEAPESLWIGEQVLPTGPAQPDGSLELPFSFAIPPGLPQSFEDYPRIEWRLNVTAAVPGLDFRESFAVPVCAEPGPEPFTLDELPRPSRDFRDHRPGDSPYQPPPDWVAGRIEADGRVGPVWPGTAGIGVVPLGAAGWLAAAPEFANQFRRNLTFAGALVMGAFLVSMFTGGDGLQFLSGLPQAYSMLVERLVWVAVAFGAGFAVIAGLRTWHRYWHLHRFGISFLRVATLPVKPGSAMRGALEIPRPVHAVGGFSFRLILAQTRWFGGNLFGPAAKTGWTGEWIAFEGHDPGNQATEVPFELAVPSDLPESGSGDGGWQWYVEVSASAPGLDYIARFLVPVQSAR
jgi:hypothetical protein